MGLFEGSFYNGFNPFLLPLVLMIYSTLSYCYITRKVSIICLVSYLLSVTIPNWIPDANSAIIASCGVLIIGYCYCMAYTETVVGLLMLGWMILLVGVIYGCLYFHFYNIDIRIFGWSVFKHSNYVFRESLISLVVSCSYTLTKNSEWKQRDWELVILVGFMYLL